MAKARITDFSGKTCVVTGAASGIGRATALNLARRGARLALTDRNAEQLERTAQQCREISGHQPTTAAFDITSLPDVEAFATTTQSALGVPDAIFHVAGISMWGSVDRMRTEDWRMLVDINLMGTIHVIQAFVPSMMSAGKPAALAMVSSAAGIIGMPWHAGYSAAKFGIRGLGEVLRFDLEAKKISVHVVCPGAVDTPLVHSIKIAGVDTSDPAVTEAQAEFSAHAVTPEEAAEKMIDGVRKGKYLIFTSRDIAVAYGAQRYFPPAYNLAMRLLNRKLMSVAKKAGIEA